MYAVFDCNNFFVSCERLFRPDLNDKPVIVLSNNDGCAVSRSNEAKPFIPMGAPFFKYEGVIKREKIQYFSANFQLYGDMSQRVMQVLHQFAPEIEQYSVDEAFVTLDSIKIRDYNQWGKEAHQRILKWTGMPVSVGIGPTKTLAKAAVELAKKHYDGVTHTLQDQNMDDLKKIPVGDVWGVGRALNKKLTGFQIKTAYDLSKLSPEWMAQSANITAANMLRELQGIDMFGGSVQYNEPSRKTISSTRTFGRRINQMHELESAVASFAARVSYRLRRSNKLAKDITVFLHTGKHSQQQKLIKSRLPLDVPTADTGYITQRAIEVLEQIYDPNYSYKRAGLLLTNLTNKTSQQLSVLRPQTEADLLEREKLMQAIDKVNGDWGKQTVKLAIEGVGEQWYSKREHTSRRYTTNWGELPIVKVV